MSKQKTCYRCERLATSKEHVPPKCIFPEFKDASGIDFRKNLITVASCDIHNTQKTKDDEFLLICIASSVQTNSYGYKHFNSKVIRALKRKDAKFLNQIVKDYEELNIVDLKGNNIPVTKGKANISRLNECFESIIRGLHYHQFKTKFDGELKIVNDFILPETNDQMSFIKLIKTAFSNDPKATNVLGENPEVFNYQFTEKDTFGVYGIRITFYEGLNIYGALKPKGAREPYDLAMALVNSGIKTTFHFPEGDIDFNITEEE